MRVGSSPHKLWAKLKLKLWKSKFKLITRLVVAIIAYGAWEIAYDMWELKLNFWQHCIEFFMLGNPFRQSIHSMDRFHNIASVNFRWPQESFSFSFHSAMCASHSITCMFNVTIWILLRFAFMSAYYATFELYFVPTDRHNKNKLRTTMCPPSN